MHACPRPHHRTSVNFWRNLGVFWLRLAMYTMLCLCIGTIYYKLDYSWKGANSRAALLFFVVAFLTFMSIAGFPAFQEDMQVWGFGWWCGADAALMLH